MPIFAGTVRNSILFHGVINIYCIKTEIRYPDNNKFLYGFSIDICNIENMGCDKIINNPAIDSHILLNVLTKQNIQIIV